MKSKENIFMKSIGLISKSRWLLVLSLVALIGVGLGLRILDLTDPPLDFHAWRQLRAANIARGKYYAMLPDADPATRDKAISIGLAQGELEPKIFETIVSLTYLIIGQEKLWIARVYAIIFWMIGGIFLYLLARKLTSDLGALTSLAIYLITPFGVIGSRAFLPEPLMVMVIMIAVFSIHKWSEKRTWKWVLMASISCGVGILIKVFAVFPLAGAAIAILVQSWGIKGALKDRQVWLFIFIAALIPSTVYIFPSLQSGSSYLKDWVFPFSRLLLEPGFYIRWLTVLNELVSLPILFASMMGIILLQGRGRGLSLGLWIGYGIFGMTIPSLIMSHTYYNLPLIPIMALSLSSIGDLVLTKVLQQSRVWRVLFMAIAMLSLAYPTIVARNTLVAVDYRPEVQGWKKLGEIMPKDGSFIGMTHDYGNRLSYYGWTPVAHWPSVSDFQMHELAGGTSDVNDPSWHNIFQRMTSSYDYFVVTVFNELDAQPIIKSILYNEYKIYDQGDGYIIFNLNTHK